MFEEEEVSSAASAAEEALAEPTKAPAQQIRAIGKETVHKICSGQVVISLAVAVKELVENAIDAGATLIEVKLREFGLESLEVSDNGSGVEEQNLQAMTAKYHTSKICEFDDLQNVETFGFRGEALNSLCALSDISIVSRHRSSQVAIKVDLNHDGEIVKRMPCARTIGTTVMLSNLFSTLPVRRKDFTRNIKKEFTKMCQILQAYCIVSKCVRIICSNQTAKASKSIIMQTHGAQDVLANISAIFGSRQTADLLRLKAPIAKPDDDEDADSICSSQQSILDELQNDIGYCTQITQEDYQSLQTAQFQLDGYVSACSHGAGRSAKDRQFFYINSRPCEPKQIANLVNEIYHRYNMQQQPFVYLNVLIPRQQVDVNLTPDKRQLLVQNEKVLLLAIKKALLNTYGNLPGSFKVQSNNMLSMFKSEAKLTENDADIDDESDDVPSTSQQHYGAALLQWKHTGDTKTNVLPVPKKRKIIEELTTVRSMKLKKIQDFLCKEVNSNEIMSYKSESDSEDENSSNKSLNQSVLDLAKLNKESAEFDALTCAQKNDNGNVQVKRIDCKVQTPVKEQPLKLIHIKTITCEQTAPKLAKQTTTKQQNQQNKKTPNKQVSANATLTSTTKSPKQRLADLESSQTTVVKNIEYDNDHSDDEFEPEQFICHEMRSSLAEIELELCSEELLMAEQQQKRKLERLRFKSEINPSQNQTAEEELEREVHKQDFARMEIIGQFNLGFILVKLDEDLFIVDQHASDEKYNFEMLQRTTQLEYQRLTMPQPLELTAVNEMLLLDHLEIFEKNGFKFEIDPNAAATKKVLLLAKPFSKNWQFGKDDIDELIFMLQDAPEGTICRPSRVRAMFASRACRKSVMIGTALSKSKMKTLIRHMGEIEQPWNCPHGRPTMRHLINIAMLPEDKEEAIAEHELTLNNSTTT